MNRHLRELRRPAIAPSILAADFGRLDEEIARGGTAIETASTAPS